MPTGIKKVGEHKYEMYDKNTGKVVGHTDSEHKAHIFAYYRDSDQPHPKKKEPKK